MGQIICCPLLLSPCCFDFYIRQILQPPCLCISTRSVALKGINLSFIFCDLILSTPTLLQKLSVRKGNTVTLTLWWSHHVQCGPVMARYEGNVPVAWPLGRGSEHGGRLGLARRWSLPAPGTGQWLTLTHWAGGSHRQYWGLTLIWSTSVYFLCVIDAAVKNRKDYVFCLTRRKTFSSWTWRMYVH